VKLCSKALIRHKLRPLIHGRTLLPLHHSLPERGKSVTYASGTIGHLCVGSLIFKFNQQTFPQGAPQVTVAL
jgi:hypothetical protein